MKIEKSRNQTADLIGSCLMKIFALNGLNFPNIDQTN